MKHSICGKLDQVGSVSWGIECGQGIPAIYSSIPDAMCWIDMIMTCVPLATVDINNDDEDPSDPRGNDEEVVSVNGLTVDECAAWRLNNQHLPELCNIVYSGERK